MRSYANAHLYPSILEAFTKMTKTALFLAVLFSIACPAAQAASATFSETGTQKLKCKKIGGVAECWVESSGKFNASAKLTPAALLARGIDRIPFDFSTLVGVSIGDFQFDSDIGQASSVSMTSATWKLTHEVCNQHGQCKDVADTTITGKIGPNSLSLKLSGNSKNGNLSFGYGLFGSQCAGNPDGDYSFNVPVTVSIDSETFTATASGTCSVKTIRKSVNYHDFDLTTVKVKGSVENLQ